MLIFQRLERFHDFRLHPKFCLSQNSSFHPQKNKWVAFSFLCHPEVHSRKHRKSIKTQVIQKHFMITPFQTSKPSKPLPSSPRFSLEISASVKDGFPWPPALVLGACLQMREYFRLGRGIFWEFKGQNKDPMPMVHLSIYLLFLPWSMVQSKMAGYLKGVPTNGTYLHFSLNHDYERKAIWDRLLFSGIGGWCHWLTKLNCQGLRLWKFAWWQFKQNATMKSHVNKPVLCAIFVHLMLGAY